MKRTLILSSAVLMGWLGLVSVSHAQVFVRAPFVRVWVGNGSGVGVRAPFVNLWIPDDGPVYYRPYGPRILYAQPPIVVQSPPTVVQPMPPATPTPPAIVDSNGPPQPVRPAQVQSLDSFAKSFQAKAGSYEVTLVNPVTKQPTTVRFNLPEGTPRRVQVTRDYIEFIYALRQWVRIEFDKDGAIVTAR